MTDELGARTGPHLGMCVLDQQGATVGTVCDMVYDNGNPDPSWLVVECGWLRHEHFVPAEGSMVTAEGDLVVPFEKKWVRGAPRAPKGHVLTSAIRRQLAIHYG